MGLGGYFDAKALHRGMVDEPGLLQEGLLGFLRPILQGSRARSHLGAVRWSHAASPKIVSTGRKGWVGSPFVVAAYRTVWGTRCQQAYAACNWEGAALMLCRRGCLSQLLHGMHGRGLAC